ncbi:MAG TPA: hypothetical protein VEC08_00910, partial [Nitrososphaerales archaeon]|nr:hypothetical protein [Nitrososphaerales archaeon]
SGDHVGDVSVCPLPLVSCAVFLPSNETNHRDLVVLSDFSFQDRFVYATQFPSGEGARSSRRCIPSMSLALNGWTLAEVEVPGFFRRLASLDYPAVGRIRRKMKASYWDNMKARPRARSGYMDRTRDS